MTRQVRIDVEVQGLKELTELLAETLPPKLQANAIARAQRRSLEPVANAMRANFQSLSGSGSLATATQIWRRRKGLKKTGTAASAEVGPRRSNIEALVQYFDYYGRNPTPKQLRGGIRHGHLVEWGTKHTAPKRPVTRAADTAGPKAIEQFRVEMGTEVDKAVRKQARQPRTRQKLT